VTDGIILSVHNYHHHHYYSGMNQIERGGVAAAYWHVECGGHLFFPSGATIENTLTFTSTYVGLSGWICSSFNKMI
jgi:hypothetical protein